MKLTEQQVTEALAGSKYAKSTEGTWKFYDEMKHYGKSSEIQSNTQTDICEAVAVIPHDDISTSGVKEMKSNVKVICDSRHNAAAAILLEAMVREMVGALESASKALYDASIAVPCEDEESSGIYEARADVRTILARAKAMVGE